MVKNLPANAGDSGDPGSIPSWRRSPVGGKDNPLQYFCLENSLDRGTWQALVHGVTKLDTTEHAHTPPVDRRKKQSSGSKVNPCNFHLWAVEDEHREETPGTLCNRDETSQNRCD